jgi:Glycosyl hydrolase family 76
MAETIFKDMAGSWDNTFGGGIYWAWDEKNDDGSIFPYKAAIANELFMAVAARLYLRTKDASYKTWAVNEANWFKSSGLINSNNLVWDSLNALGRPDTRTTFWTYNCGVILHALCDLSIMTGDPSNRVLAEQIADAAIQYFSNNAGILIERSSDTSIGTCQFKGVLIRNLAALFANDLKANYGMFITHNASSVLANGNASSQFGKNWDSPHDSVDFVRQSAAIDAINAANRVVIAAGPISVTKVLALIGQKPPVGLRQEISWLTNSVRAWATAMTT